MKNEKWKDVVGFEGLYKVSNIGRVKTLKRNIYDNSGSLHYVQKEKIMRGTTYQAYPIVRLRKNGISRNTLIHRIVAIAFIPNVSNKPFINHKNGIKTDNRVENLEWCTKGENETHAYAYLGKVSHFQGLIGKKHPRSIPVLQKDLEGNLIKRWESANRAKIEGGFETTCIGLCASGKLKTHSGFKWEYDA